MCYVQYSPFYMLPVLSSQHVMTCVINSICHYQLYQGWVQ